MRLYLTTLCAWMLPFAGVCLLFAGLAPHSLGTRLNEASTMDEVQAHPACFNPARRVQLRQAYRCYRRQRVRLSQAQSPSALAECRAAVREAVGSYNEVAADTDPSAFERTNFPRRISASLL